MRVLAGTHLIGSAWKKYNTQKIVLMKSVVNTGYGPLNAARKMTREPFIINHCCLTEFEREFTDSEQGRRIKRGIDVHFMVEALEGYALQETDTVIIDGSVNEENVVTGGHEFRISGVGRPETVYGTLFMKIECVYE
ncbi:MAG: hypothetical protein JXK07_10010 [Spirochaetes bacterium]|nr:hypothetical protein [Spirochaetota bacterium]MBN2771268.1 hypothetical protein [Spirochaetota bacterium]